MLSVLRQLLGGVRETPHPVPLCPLPAGFPRQSLLVFVAFAGQSHSGSDSERVMERADKGHAGGRACVLPVHVLPGRSEPHFPHYNLGSPPSIKKTNFICCSICHFCLLLREGTRLAISCGQSEGSRVCYEVATWKVKCTSGIMVGAAPQSLHSVNLGRQHTTDSLARPCCAWSQGPGPHLGALAQLSWLCK